MNGILKAQTADGGGTVEQMFREVIVDELMGGSALIWRDEGQGEGRAKCMLKMHRIVQRFIMSSMERGSGLWNEVYRTVLRWSPYMKRPRQN